MKRIASLAPSATMFALLSALALLPQGSALAASKKSAAPEFQLCFEVTGGRCFTVDSAKPGFLRQVGGLSDSDAKIATAVVRKFEKEMTQFMKHTENAKAEKAALCERALSFRLLDHANDQGFVEHVRCIEKLSSSDTKHLLSLTDRLSKASKPARR